jgi:hypothetical protein
VLFLLCFNGWCLTPHPSRRKKSIGLVLMRPQAQVPTFAQTGGLRHFQSL